MRCARTTRMEQTLSSPRTIAFFDFDGTLVRGDSLLPFLGYAAGWIKTGFAFALALAFPQQGHPDYRTGVKAALLARTLKGVPEDKARRAAAKLNAIRYWKDPAYSALLKHKEDGALIVVATGALELYIRTLIADLPVDVVLATEMETKDGILTGAMRGGNCVRQEKARRVAALLLAEGPFATSYGYGNAPSDLPMLALLDHKMVI